MGNTNVSLSRELLEAYNYSVDQFKKKLAPRMVLFSVSPSFLKALQCNTFSMAVMIKNNTNMKTKLHKIYVTCKKAILIP